MFGTGIHRKYKNIKRYQTIISVLIKHGFYDFVDHTNLIQYAKFSKRFLPGKFYPKEENLKLTRWERIRFVLEELGPAFVKLGQFISNRPDIIPKTLCVELENLLDHVSPFDGKLAQEILEKELNAPVKDVFSEFSIKPISSASISQVHKGALLDGSPVAIKIQRPKVKETVETDLEIMIHIAHLAERFVEGMAALHPVEIIEDFRAEISNELDFTIEAANIGKFKSLYGEDKRLYITHVYKEYTTQKILMLEFIDAYKLTNIASGEIKCNPQVLTDIIADMVLMQFFEKGFFHADPHSGNILVMPDNRICFIDFGLVGVLPPKHKESLCDIITGLVSHDSEKITVAIISISQNKEIENRSRLEHQVFKVVEHYAYIPLADINIGHFLSDLLRLIIDNKLKIPTDIYLLLKALISLEGTVRKIKPDFDMISHVEPFVKKLIYEHSNPFNILKDLYRASIKYSQLLQELPASIKEIVDQIKNKSAKIQFEHKGLEPMLHKHDQISNRLSYSIVTASMLISSALILHARIPPRIQEISILGMIIFLFAVMMGSFLLISILRHGKM